MLKLNHKSRKLNNVTITQVYVMLPNNDYVFKQYSYNDFATPNHVLHLRRMAETEVVRTCAKKGYKVELIG